MNYTPMSSFNGSTTAADLLYELQKQGNIGDVAFRNALLVEAARRHWLARVLAIEALGRTPRAVAMYLAPMAGQGTLGLEIWGYFSNWGEALGLGRSAVAESVAKLENVGLVAALDRGAGMRPTHLLLPLSVVHWQEAARAAEEERRDSLDRAETAIRNGS